MTTAATAYTTLRSLLAAGIALPIRWRGDDTDSAGDAALPDTPTSFVYCEFLTEPAAIAGFGGGRGANLYRNPARLDIYVFVPRGDGSEEISLGHAETAAAVFRSYRDANLSCFSASVLSGGNGADLQPPGIRSEVNSYSYAVAEVELYFDQIG